MNIIKPNARKWIELMYDKLLLTENENVTFYFTVKGFADDPKVYLQPAYGGLEIGYEAVKWDGPSHPYLTLQKQHFLSREKLQSLSKEQQQELTLELLMKTIDSRKRQYRKCQFCGAKVAPEHRFNQNTCHGCASERFGVLY